MDYICPRCGYTTDRNSNMRSHMFKKKKPCPATKNVIELTDAIKQHVLDNRIYFLPQAPQTIINNINYNNTINNYISNMDFMDKFTKYITYKNINIIDFNDNVLNRFGSTMELLDDTHASTSMSMASNASHDTVKLSMNEFMDILDQTTSICNDEYEGYNIHLDNTTQKLNLYEDGEWKSFLKDAGIKRVVAGIQDYFLDAYELYLVRKLFGVGCDAFQKQEVRQYLAEYYHFLACFNLMPYVNNRTNSRILTDESVSDDRDFTISDAMLQLYHDKLSKLTVIQRSRVHKDVYDIIKRNSKHNLDDLNKKVSELFDMDEEFRVLLTNKKSKKL
jgi:hypothetical protein